MRDSQAKRILFTELRRGPLTEVEASLWPAGLRAEMIREGVVRKLEDGGLALVNAVGYASNSDRPSTIPPPNQSGTMPAVHVTLPTLTGRVPQDALDYLDSIADAGESRSETLRRVMAEVVTKGIGRKTRSKAAGQ